MNGFEFLTIDDGARKNVPLQTAKKGVLAPFCIAKTLRLSNLRLWPVDSHWRSVGVFFNAV
jgi:hypothetical protein